MTTLLEIDPLSHLVTVSTEISYQDLQLALFNEGFEWPYLPLGTKPKDLATILYKQSLNFHYLSEGSLADTISSFTFEYTKNKAFELKDSPRAACGPDFKSLLSGTKTSVGQISSVTLKLNKVPSHYLACVIPNCDSADASHIIQKCVLNFHHPYGVIYESSSDTLWKNLKLKTSGQSKTLLLLWSGQTQTQKAATTFITDLCQNMALKADFKNLVSIIEQREALLKHKPKLDWKNLYTKSVWQTSVKPNDAQLRNELLKEFEKI